MNTISRVSCIFLFFLTSMVYAPAPAAAANCDGLQTEGNLAGGSYTMTDDCTLTGMLGVIAGNTVSIDGGGFTIDGAGISRVLNIGGNTNVTLTNVTITGGMDTQGAGIFNAGTLTITNTTITGNTATGGIASGGGIYNLDGTIQITDSEISSNTAYVGGAIHSTDNGSVTITDSVISGNTAVSDGAGGGISTRGGLNITGAVISGNSGATGGGIYANASAVVEIRNTTFHDNDAVGRGAAIEARVNTNVTLRHVTISGHTAGTNVLIGLDSAFYNVYNSIIAGNSITNCGSTVNINSGSLEDTDTCGLVSGANTDPLLDAFTGTHYPLQANSPAIDTAPDCSGLLTDQIGTTRPQGSACDSGAIEVVQGQLPVRLYPTDSQVLDGPGDYDWPRFSFQATDDVEWYAVWVGKADFSATALFEWFEAAQICDAGLCTVPVDLWLTDGDYVWWMSYWGPDFPNIFTYWNETTFSVDFDAPGAFALTSPPDGGTVNAVPTTIEWARDTSVLWYQIWVGPNTYATSQYFAWVDATEICDAMTCSIDVSDQTFADGGYEVWAEMWGPGGYATWPAVPSGTFTLDTTP